MDRLLLDLEQNEGMLLAMELLVLGLDLVLLIVLLLRILAPPTLDLDLELAIEQVGMLLGKKLLPDILLLVLAL